MSFAAPIARLDAPLARRNPVAKLVAGLLLSLFLLATLDPLAPAIALAVMLGTVPLFGMRYRDLARRTWPILVGSVGILLSLLLFGTAGTWAELLMSALGLSLRLLAIALPGVLIFATTDPTDLADALIQNARAPARFAIGTLAAFRLLPLLAQEWHMLQLARRARGVAGGLRSSGSTAFALLVGAIRRGTDLATAMDARGFDARVPRTVARPQRFGLADLALIAAAGLLGAIAIGASVWAGTFDPLLA